MFLWLEFVEICRIGFGCSVVCFSVILVVCFWCVELLVVCFLDVDC